MPASSGLSSSLKTEAFQAKRCMFLSNVKCVSHVSCAETDNRGKPPQTTAKKPHQLVLLTTLRRKITQPGGGLFRPVLKSLPTAWLLHRSDLAKRSAAKTLKPAKLSLRLRTQQLITQVATTSSDLSLMEQARAALSRSDLSTVCWHF